MPKRLAAVMLAVCLIFTAMPVHAAVEYMALGDSIARGYGLKDPAADSYPSKFAAENGLTFENYGIDGQTAEELLDDIKNDKYDFTGVKVVTVSAGSNELLHYIIGMIAKEFGVEESEDGLEQALASMPADMIAEHISNVRHMLVNNSELNAICDKLRDKTIPGIAAEIKKRNADAIVIFNNIYDPYKNMALVYPISRSTYIKIYPEEYFQPYVDRVNSGLKSTDSYLVADICSVFVKAGYVNASLDMREPEIFTFDPHPTRAGHNVIKNEVSKVYRSVLGDDDVTSGGGIDGDDITSGSGIVGDDVTSGSAVKDKIPYGDVNYDGRLTAEDSAIVLQYTLNKFGNFDEEKLKRADVDANGVVNAADSSQILQKVLVSGFMFKAESTDEPVS